MKYLTILSAILLTTLMACGGAASDAQSVCDCMNAVKTDLSKAADCITKGEEMAKKYAGDSAYTQAIGECAMKVYSR